MTSHANPTYELKALVLAPNDNIGREWCDSASIKAREVRIGNEARQFKGYPRDLPIYILHDGHSSEHYQEQIALIRERFKTTREVFV